MSSENDIPIVLEDFLGLWNRGLSDSAPKDHAQDCLNLEFNVGQMKSRAGLKQTLALPRFGCRRFFLSTMNDANLRMLILDTTGHLDVEDGTNLLNIPAMTDFVALNEFNRTYITPLQGSTPVPGEKLYVYNGTTIRPAAGPAPVSSALVLTQPSAGNVPIGVHKVAVAYVTNSGFITPPGPKIAGVFTSTSISSDGTHNIHVANIPIGPSYVTQRWLLVTKADEEEFFFAPFGLINDNTTTTLNLNFFDTDLQISADYLFDLLEVIPAGRSLTKYQGRMIIIEDGDVVFVSLPGDPESISSVDGVINMPAEKDGNRTTAGFVLRGILYLTKLVGLHSTYDTGGPPSQWPITLVDGSIGAYHYGISSFTAAQPAKDTSDFVALASIGGLLLFDGVARRPELSWKIQDLWQRANFNNFFKITVSHDIWKHRFYINLPLDSSQDPNVVIMGDYTEAFDNIYFAIADPRKMKWCPWKFQVNPTAIGMAYTNQDGKYEFRVSSSDNGTLFLWGLDDNTINDDCTAINSFWYQGLLELKPGIHYFNLFRTRSLGEGNLNISVADYDRTRVVNLPPIALAMAPGKTFQRKMNFVAERVGVKWGTFNQCDKFLTDRVEIFAQPAYGVRPE